MASPASAPATRPTRLPASAPSPPPAAPPIKAPAAVPPTTPAARVWPGPAEHPDRRSAAAAAPRTIVFIEISTRTLRVIGRPTGATYGAAAKCSGPAGDLRRGPAGRAP